VPELTPSFVAGEVVLGAVCGSGVELAGTAVGRAACSPAGVVAVGGSVVEAPEGVSADPEPVAAMATPPNSMDRAAAPVMVRRPSIVIFTTASK